jgi:ubiquinone/menaquinone biosynthesis C-methylase UbiE
MMNRTPEPELMEDGEQVLAYAEADFDAPHSHFISLLESFLDGQAVKGYVLDLGCGPGDITFRVADAFPDCIIHGLDGSDAMLRCGRKRLERSSHLHDRIRFVQGILPNVALPRDRYEVVISNSLLHHLADPQSLWRAVHRFAQPEAPVFIMDLVRPDSPDQAKQLVDTYAADEPEILRRDFYNSLLAAFAIDEIANQLTTADLGHFSVEQISDRHVVVSGHRDSIE